MIAPLADRFGRLEQARGEVEAELRSLSPAQLSFRESEGSWSIGEVIDHIVRVESSVLEGASRKGVKRAGWKPRPVRRAIAWAVFRVGVRLKVPERVRHVVPQHGVSAADALRRWTEVRTAMRDFLESIPHDDLGLLAIKHPIAGPFNYRDFLAFLEWHLRHHRRQIGRIRTSPAFP